MGMTRIFQDDGTHVPVTVLKVEDCEFGPECDLAFEDSDVEATVRTAIVSVKNPRSGSIKALAIGETIKDANILAPADCKIETKL